MPGPPQQERLQRSQDAWSPCPVRGAQLPKLKVAWRHATHSVRTGKLDDLVGPRSAECGWPDWLRFSPIFDGIVLNLKSRAVLRICVTCDRTFEPSSRHLRCPACRSRDKCPCGAEKQRKSQTCHGCSTQSGSFNSNWKDGRTYHKAGYVMLKAPEHPRASRTGYVFEHILVIEE
jgi:hypothetical protein